MRWKTLKLPRPNKVSIGGDFFVYIETKVASGGRFHVTCGYPINPKSLFCSIQPKNPKDTNAACFVRGVAWDNLSLYAYLEIIDGRKWLETGEIVYWNGPLTLQYCFHGQASETTAGETDKSQAVKSRKLPAKKRTPALRTVKLSKEAMAKIIANQEARWKRAARAGKARTK